MKLASIFFTASEGCISVIYDEYTQKRAKIGNFLLFFISIVGHILYLIKYTKNLNKNKIKVK